MSNLIKTLFALVKRDLYTIFVFMFPASVLNQVSINCFVYRREVVGLGQIFKQGANLLYFPHLIILICIAPGELSEREGLLKIGFSFDTIVDRLGTSIPKCLDTLDQDRGFSSSFYCN